jgi:tryptophan synthase alpha chain
MKLAIVLESLQNANRKGLVVYFTAGCPDYKTTAKAVLAAVTAGADVIEIGMPFSDPMADGPVIQKAATQALKAGATTGNTLELIRQIRQHSQVPLVVMTYVNTVLQYGVDRFARDFSEAGVDGIIVPDLPIEESGLIEAACRQNSLDTIQLVAPTSTGERIAAICEKTGGFLYCVSSTGVTGIRDIDYRPVSEVIRTVRDYSSIPVAIGFGIGSPQAACTAAQYADAVIVGSAVMQRLMDEGVQSVSEFVGAVRKALDAGGE